MTETAKERIYREAFEEIKRVCDTQDHVDNDLLRFFITKKMMEVEKLTDNTDKLSVEILQEQLNTTKKALIEITKIPESDNYFDEEERLSCIKEAAEKALAAIRGDDESLDN